MRTIKNTYLFGGALLGAAILGLCSALPLALEVGTRPFPFEAVIPVMVIGGGLGALLGYLLREKTGVKNAHRQETDSLEIRRLTEDGKKVDGRLPVTPVCHEKGRPVGITSMEQDITDDRQSRDATIRSAKDLQQILESSMTAISIIQDGRVTYKNPAYEELTGPLPGLFELTDFEHIYAADVGIVRAFYERLSSGESESGDVEFRFWPTDGSGGRLGMKWVHCRGIRIIYNDKEGMLFNYIDMTGIREMDRLLISQEKMASLGRVSAAITHEIRNALSSINIYLHTLDRMCDQTEGRDKEKEIIEQIKNSSNHIEGVVKTVKDFSKPGDFKPELSDINEAAEAALDMCSSTLRKEGIRVEKLLDQGLPRCYLDRAQIQRVFMNLLLNAADALRDVNRDNRLIEVASYNYKEHGSIALRVSDNGPGVPLDIRGIIFEPFYTSKDDSTGIGLTMCQRIVKDHGGLIYARDSSLGGAEFVIELPPETVPRS